MTKLDRSLLERTAFVAIARMALLGLWFLAITFVYRTLGEAPGGVAQVGVISLCFAAQKMIVGALGDPLDMQVVRTVPPLLPGDPTSAAAVWRAAQQFRMVFAATAVFLGTALSGTVAAFSFHDADLAPLVILSAIAAAGEFVYRGYLVDRQARQQFPVFLALESGLQVARVGIIGAAVLADRLSAETVVGAYAAATLAMAAVAALATDRERRRLLRIDGAKLGATWRYIAWVIPAMMVSALAERLDLVLLTVLRGPAESGYYGALLPLLLVPEVVAGFATTVLQPTIAAIRGADALLRFWRDLSLLTIPGAALAWFALSLGPETLVELTIGPAYRDAGPALLLLAGGVMTWVGLAPVPLTYVVMRFPKGTLAISLMQVTLMGSLSAVLIPQQGAMGAAMAFFAVRVTTSVVLCTVALIALMGERRAQAG